MSQLSPKITLSKRFDFPELARDQKKVSTTMSQSSSGVSAKLKSLKSLKSQGSILKPRKKQIEKIYADKKPDKKFQRVPLNKIKAKAAQKQNFLLPASAGVDMSLLYNTELARA